MESCKPPLCMATDTELCESCDPCKKLKDVEIRLALSDKLGESLRNQRANLKSAVNHSHDRIIGRLPLEIASYIFQLYVDTPKPGQLQGDVIFYKTNSTPFRLGAVCRAWRAIVWSSPQLWKRLSISISLKGNKPIPDLARQWLDNSGSCPLSINLYERDGSYLDDLDLEEEDFILEVIEVVNSVSARWNSLTARLESTFLQSICSTGDKGQPSILRELCLISTDAAFPMQDFIENNPGHLPTHLSICNVRPSKQGAEWANLIQLHAKNLTTEECIRVLQQAPCLVDLTFVLDENLLRNNTGDHHPGRTVIHPGLRSFRFTEADSDASAAKLYAMINLVALPSLQNIMVISADQFDSMSLIDTLISLIERSTCRLITLQVEDYGGPAEQLIRLLHMTPSLKHLDITFDEHAKREDFMKHLMKAMLKDPSHSTFLPRLKIFETNIHCNSRGSWEAFLLLDFFDTGHDGQPWRLNRPWPLTLHFRMMYLECGYIPIQTMRRLLRLSERGILISITHSGDNLVRESLSLYDSQGEQL